MKRLSWFKFAAVALVVLLAACGAGKDGPDGRAVEGPALVMWYTDN
jgi:hypothetical protein